MTLKYFISGLFVKAVTGFDDTMVHIPVVATITRTRVGKIAFAIGILLAVILAIIISIAFASVIKLIPYFKYVSAILIFLLALSIQFDFFIHHPIKKVEAKFKQKKIKGISKKRFVKLLGIGFLTAFATVIDDTIAYSALFLGALANIPFAIAGILTTTFAELFIIIKFSKQVSKFKYKKEITVFGLIILSFLIWIGVL